MNMDDHRKYDSSKDNFVIHKENRVKKPISVKHLIIEQDRQEIRFSQKYLNLGYKNRSSTDYLWWNIGYYKQDIADNKYNHLKILYLDSVDIDNESVTKHEIGLTAKDTKKEDEEKILGLLKKD